VELFTTPVAVVDKALLVVLVAVVRTYQVYLHITHQELSTLVVAQVLTQQLVPAVQALSLSDTRHREIN